MQEIAAKRQRMPIREVRLRLQSTDIPSDALPRGARDERLILPAPARLFLRDDVLCIEMILLDVEEYGNQYYIEPDFDDENPAVICLNLQKEDIHRLEIGGRTYHGWKPTAVLVIDDPGEVVPSLTLTFASTDHNNPSYPVLALAKMLRERLGVAIEETDQREDPDGLGIPF